MFVQGRADPMLAKPDKPAGHVCGRCDIPLGCMHAARLGQAGEVTLC